MTELVHTQENISKISGHRYFETKRLLVRQYLLNDIGELLKVMSDIRVHTYTKDKNSPWDIQRTEEYIQFMMNKDFKTLDNFHGAIVEKKTNQLIGVLFVKLDDAFSVTLNEAVPVWKDTHQSDCLTPACCFI